jgi:DNA polymerase III subunit delta'
MARAAVIAQTEDLPEADRLEGFPHPRVTARLFCHSSAELMLSEALASQKLHHAWLITGPEGIGKATIALTSRPRCHSPHL